MGWPALTEFEFQSAGNRVGGDRAVLLAPGAGADMHAPTLTAFADALEARGIPSLRFNFAYRTAGKGAPPKAPILEAEVREAIQELAQRSNLTVDRLVVGGRSMGGRICSMVAAADGALGCALLAYPLHPPGKPDTLRVAHFPELTMPVLFVSGTRDSFGTPDELQREAASIRSKVDWYWIDTADHGFRPLKKVTGLTTQEVLVPAAIAVAEWVERL